MRRFSLILIALLPAIPVWADGQCVPPQSMVIDAEVHCAPKGISIGLGDEEGAKVSCMANKEVQGRCGPDGQITRLHAYTLWFNKVKEFERSCTSQGGTFSYKDPNFIEPSDESYCQQAIPEVSANMFEEPLCNFRSACPGVTVVCERPCAEHSIARLY